MVAHDTQFTDTAQEPATLNSRGSPPPEETAQGNPSRSSTMRKVVSRNRRKLETASANGSALESEPITQQLLSQLGPLYLAENQVEIPTNATAKTTTTKRAGRSRRLRPNCTAFPDVGTCVTDGLAAGRQESPMSSGVPNTKADSGCLLQSSALVTKTHHTNGLSG